MVIHNCQQKQNEIYKSLKSHQQHYEYGGAISGIFTNFGDSEYFWTDNGEYSSSIIYCPYCGIDMRTLLEKK